MEFELHQPSTRLFGVSLVFAVLAAIGWIVTIPLVSTNATPLALVAFAILALSNAVRT